MGLDSGPTRTDGAVPGVDAARADAARPDGAVAGCTYPAGAVEPMALGAVIWPYRWPQAIDGAGRNVPLDLVEAHCTADENIDWSPFDVLLFISIPAW